MAMPKNIKRIIGSNGYAIGIVGNEVNEIKKLKLMLICSNHFLILNIFGFSINGFLVYQFRTNKSQSKG